MTEFEELGARFVAVAPQAPAQAAYLRDERGVTDVPLLLDPDHEMRRLTGLGKLGVRGVLSARGGLNWLRSLGSGRQGRITGFDLQPGVVVADGSLRVVEIWRGTTYGDYPPLDDVLAVLGR